MNLMPTVARNTIQVIARDNAKDILIIVTWDLCKNIEVSMFQVKVLPD